MLSFLLLVLSFAAFVLSILVYQNNKGLTTKLRYTSIVLSILCTLSISFNIVPTSHIGVVKTFGKVSSTTLSEGAHFVAPWQNVVKVRVGMDVLEVTDNQAASKDLQSINSDLVVNFYADPSKAASLYQLDPKLEYRTNFVYPTTAEVFKAVVAQYTAEELVTKRQQVSEAIVRNLNTRLAQYHLKVQTVNMVNFGFSKAFDAAIEEKVTASQKAETAKRNLERVKAEAESRIAQAEGEAKAIAIQAAAIDKQGGAAYVQLKALEKWDGKLPVYMTSGAATPFIQVK